MNQNSFEFESRFTDILRYSSRHHCVSIINVSFTEVQPDSGECNNNSPCTFVQYCIVLKITIYLSIDR